MHKDFADWYRLVDLEPKGETLEKRWQAIEQFCESVNAAQALELIRLFYGRSATTSTNSKRAVWIFAPPENVTSNSAA